MSYNKSMTITARYRQEAFSVEHNKRHYTALRFENLQDGGISYSIKDDGKIFANVNPNTTTFKIIANAIEYRKSPKS
jgi:hypothetical protein